MKASPQLLLSFSNDIHEFFALLRIFDDASVFEDGLDRKTSDGFFSGLLTNNDFLSAVKVPHLHFPLTFNRSVFRMFMSVIGVCFCFP